MFSFWDKLFKKKPQYDIEALRREASRYLAENYKPPKPVVPVSEKPAQYSVSEGRPSQHTQFQTWAPEEEEPHVQYSHREYSTNQLLSGYSLNNLTPGEARTLRMVLDERREKSFSELLMQYIRDHGYKASYVYKRAQIDKRLFSNIKSNPSYKPAKDTVIAFALALSCSLEEADRLLKSAGFALSDSSTRDTLLRYFFVSHLYDLTAVNEILDGTGEKIIGRENVG